MTANTQETKVTMASEVGTANQWGRGLFYRDDGRKKTIVPKYVAGTMAAVFSCVALTVFFQGTPERGAGSLSSRSGSEATQSSFPVPDGTAIDAAPGAVLIPQVAEGENSGAPRQVNRSHKATGASESASRAKSKFSGPLLISRPHNVKIQPGTLVKAVLVSGASNGPIRAEITESFSANGETVLDAGTVLLGNGQSGDDRLAVRFSQMVFRDGGFASIDAAACDSSDKIPGLKGSKVGGYAGKLALGIGLSFVGGMTEALQDSSGQGGVVVRPPTVRNALLNGTATTALGQSHEIMSEARNKPTVIEIAPGTAIFVLFSGN